MASDDAPAPMKRALSSHYPQSEHGASRQSSPHRPGAHDNLHKLPAHKAHRQHLVGGNRGRNLSHKSLNKLQKLALTHNLATTESGEQPAPPTIHRHHQRKKSAPASPSTSPRAGPHVRWNGSVVSLSGNPANAPMKKNLSTPALRRNTTEVKKGHPLSKPPKSGKTEKKKTVGFELADSDEDDEWEDHSSLSATSTRRNSLATPGKMNGDVITKSPLAHESKVTESLKSPTELRAPPEPSQPWKPLGPEHIASRILNRPHSKAPPTISSISATAKPAVIDRSPRSPSFANLSSSITSVNPNSSSFTIVNPHGTSSSAEGGVSRFLTNDPHGLQAQSASNPSTPSSFLPHYHPNTPPSPDVVAKRPKSPTSRRRLVEPASRTQQKLWLQRTATMSTSPPEQFMGGLRPTIGPSAMNQSYVPNHSRSSSGTFGDGRRAVVSFSGLPVGAVADNEAKRGRKVYDRLTSELSVVQRFRDPIADSFTRLLVILGPETRVCSSRGRSSRPRMNGHVSSATVLSQSRSRAVSPRETESGPSSQFLTRSGNRESQTRLQDQYHVNADDNPDAESGLKDVSPEDPTDETGDPRVDGYANGLDTSQAMYHANEEEMLLRRMWECREVAVEGD